MALGKIKKGKGRVRLAGVKKKIEELAILCGVEAVLICLGGSDDDPSSCHTWLDDRNTCISLVEKFRSISFHMGSSGKNHNKNAVGSSISLGKKKRERRSEDQTSLCENENKELEKGKGKKVGGDEVSEMGFLDYSIKICGGVDLRALKVATERAQLIEEISKIDGKLKLINSLIESTNLETKKVMRRGPPLLQKPLIKEFMLFKMMMICLQLKLSFLSRRFQSCSITTKHYIA